MVTVTKVFDELGGSTAVAAALGVQPSTASEMKRRGSIPVKYWTKLIVAARQRGKVLTYEKLAHMHAEKIA